MKLKSIVGIMGIAAFVASWIAVGVGFALGVDKETWVILVVVAAFASEAMIWCIAAMLGLRIFEARNKILRWLKQPFTRVHRATATGQQAD